MDENIMKYETVLPVDFDGTFRFTNWTDEDFVGVWGGKEYHYPAKSTSPMVIPEHSPLEIQHIRKKFAKDLAERAFYSSKQYKDFMKQERNPDGSARLNGIHSAATYTMNELAPFIQKCLEPLPITRAQVTTAPREQIEDKLTRGDDGQLNTEVVDKNTSLRAKALSK